MFLFLSGYPADQYDLTIYPRFWLCVPSCKDKGERVPGSFPGHVYFPFSNQSVQLLTVFSMFLYHDACSVRAVYREGQADRHRAEVSVSYGRCADGLF